MFIFPFLGIVISLALWGSMVPEMGLNPAEHLLKKVSGSTKTSFLLSGPFQLFVMAPILDRPDYEGVDDYSEPVDLLALQATIDSDTVAVPECFVVDPIPVPAEFGPSSQPTSTAVDFDSIDFHLAYQEHLHVFIVVAVVYLVNWLSLWIIETITRSDVQGTLTRLVIDSAPKSNYYFEGNVTMTIDSSEMVAFVAHPSICDSVLALLDQTNSTTNWLPTRSWDLVPYFNLASRFSQARPVASSRWTDADVLSFHPIVDQAIYQLVIKACMVTTDSPVVTVNSADPDTAAPVSGSNPLEALVLRRLENVSRLVFLDMVGFVLANWEDLLAAKVKVVPQAESNSLAPGRKRLGKKQRHRMGRRKLRQEQDAVINTLAPPSV